MMSFGSDVRGIRLFSGASLLAIDRPSWSLHLLVMPDHWVWGRSDNQYMISWGCGPLFLFCADPEWVYPWWEDYIHAE